jgi:hypothetical protein
LVIATSQATLEAAQGRHEACPYRDIQGVGVAYLPRSLRFSPANPARAVPSSNIEAGSGVLDEATPRSM